MKFRWKKFLFKIIVWLAAEIMLNCMEIDDIADYREFVFERYIIKIQELCNSKKSQILLVNRLNYRTNKICLKNVEKI